MIKNKNFDSLFEDFLKEKKELESTLSTIEILKDENLIKEINKGLLEIKNNESETLTFEEIDNL